MNSFWKGVSLTIILLFGLVVVYNIFIRHSQSPNDMAVQNQEEYQRQVETYEQQAKKASEQQLETERQLKESARQQEISKAQIKRMDLLLERWEKQADKYDAILEKWENQVSIKTQ
jgi:septal ring factor EnvC (AmiA/AmiB activator)